MFNLDKNYEAAGVEDKWYSNWLENKLFHGDSGKGGESYSIVIPPPNVTNILHMGHALNATIQDMLVRWQRMQGKNTVWVPGTDHAGIATQNMVEKALKKEGLSRQDLGREEFLKRVWAWREKYGSSIINQLKKLGASCDWDRERFTMDEGLSNAVAEVFVRLYNKKLIYRGNYIINWCPRCQTALSDEESEHVDENGKLYYLRYPVEGGRKKDAVIVATTRPETMLGDVAVAVNPRDNRHARLIGKNIVLPIVNRVIPVIEDDFVDPEFGTGVVKVTPAHDPNDFMMGQRHELTPINVMNEDGTMNNEAGVYAGLDRFECRRKIVEDLTKAKLIEKIEDHQHAVGHCYRCDTVVEPRLSLQWFVKMKPLARPAIEAVKEGRIKFVPERWTKVYLDWMENIRDWCISRQIWWGHRIPVFYCGACQHEWAEKGSPQKCPACGSADFTQDEDVLDTWFSSWLWPISVFGWPEQNQDLKFYYPTNTLVTASEIIFFWVARMIMAGIEFAGDIPFSQVYIHGTVRDDQGRKMSKSLGNSIDPLAIIDKFSADALRFSLMMVTAVGQDIYISNEKFEVGRNFLTKIWNAARFIQMNSEDMPAFDPKPVFNPELLSAEDKYILAGLNSTIEACSESMERFRFNDAARELYEFIWRQYCDWYIECSKEALNGADADKKESVLSVMHYVFSRALLLLHPIAPFITEELWHGMGYNAVSDSIVTAPWPKVLSAEECAELGITNNIVANVELKHELIRMGRNLKSDYNIPPSHRVSYVVKPGSDAIAQFLETERSSMMALLKADNITIDKDFVPKAMVPNGVNRLGTIFMPIEGLVDIDAELGRLDELLQKINNDLAGVNKKLGNMDFIKKAPKAVVDMQHVRKQELLAKREKITRLSAMLSKD